MNHIDIIDEHLIIRETVGYEVLSQVPIEDMPKVMEFLKIVYNYNRMKRAVKEEEEPGWSDPMIEHLDREEKESEWQKRKRIETMKEAKKQEENYKKSLFALKEMQDERELIKKILDDPFNADGFSDDDHRNPKYNYQGFTYILNAELTRILGVEVPSAQVERHWLMEDLKEKDEAVRKFKLDDSFKKALEEAVVSDTPASSWMDEYKEAYDHLRNSGMFWEFHPTWTGKWEEDKYAFCHDRKFKKK